MMYKLGWFSTGRDMAAQELLKAVKSAISQGEIKAEIDFVFCNREPGESLETDSFLNQVQEYHIPLVCLSHRKFKESQATTITSQTEALPAWRLHYDRQIMERLAGFRPDLCVLAGYMLIVGEEMCQKYDMVNLHPAAPGGPSGTWQEVIWQLIGNRARETGVMMHLVTPELDQGPAVTYGTFPIRGGAFDTCWSEIEGQTVEGIIQSQGEHNRLFQLIRQHGLAREFPLIISTLKAFSEGRVRITADKKVADADGKPIRGYNLTDEINKVVGKTLEVQAHE